SKQIFLTYYSTKFNFMDSISKANKSIKTIVFFLALIILSQLKGLSQEQRPLRFGLKVSPNVGWFKPDTKGVSSDGTQWGFSYGLMSEFAIAGSFNYSFLTGLEISTNGGNLTYTDLVDPLGTGVSVVS